jgi:hypothetical protein
MRRANDSKEGVVADRFVRDGPRFAASRADDATDRQLSSNSNRRNPRPRFASLTRAICSVDFRPVPSAFPSALALDEETIEPPTADWSFSNH